MQYGSPFAENVKVSDHALIVNVTEYTVVGKAGLGDVLYLILAR